jgi:putative transcriptional regulator
MIKCHLSAIMGKKKLKISDVAQETGLPRNTITLLYKEEAVRIELDAMEKLCIYFDCSVIVQWVICLNMHPMSPKSRMRAKVN